MSFSDKKSVLDEGGSLRTPIGEHNIPHSTLPNTVFVAYFTQIAFGNFFYPQNISRKSGKVDV